jgi:PAS domain S-box-containing protein
MITNTTSPPIQASLDLLKLCGSITQRAPLPMAMVDGACHIVREVNPAFCRALGKPRAELIQKRFAEAMPDESRCLAAMDRVYRSGKSESHTERGNSKRGPLFWSYTMWPVMTDKRPVGVMIQVAGTAKFHAETVAMNEALILGSVRQHEIIEAAKSSNARLQDDIDDCEKAGEELERTQVRLTDRAGQLEGLVTERTSELTTTTQQLEAFVYSIAHDLRAPLRAMQGFSALLVVEAGAALSDTARHYAARIQQSALYMDALLIDLLAFSRISQQRIELNPVSLETVGDGD